MTDLGPLDGPVLVFGGAYGNLEATAAILAEAARRRIPARRVICTGDLAAYCADPQATAAAVRAAGIPVVRGNCEESLGFDLDDCGCGYDEGTLCDLLSVQWFAYCRAQVDTATKAWMRDLPARIDFALAGRRFAAVHGAPSSVNRLVFESAPDEALAAELDAAGTDAVVCGHSGLPFARTLAGRLWLNAGAVGMPANDGTPRAWYAVLAPRPDGAIAVEIAPLAYPHARAVAKMRAAGLPAPYADALETGLWPSLEVLPAAERRRRGVPLARSRLIWPARAAVG